MSQGKKCASGGRSELEVEASGDCIECVGIKTITNNASNGTITVTLTDGRSFTFNAKGPKGDDGAAGADGSNGAPGIVVLANQYPGLATLGTAFESLLEGRTGVPIAANTLATDGDELKGVVEIFSAAPVAAAPYQVVKIKFGPNDLIGLFDYPGFSANNIHLIKLHYRIVRVANDTIKFNFDVQYFGVAGAPSFTRYSIQTTEIDTLSLNGYDLAANSYDFDVQAKSKTAGDMTCQSLELLYLKS